MTQLAPGTVVDRFVVDRLLGTGGMARVYAVRHQVLDTRHALKVLHTVHPKHRERLVREGQLQARLDPAHVVPVTDVIQVHGAPALIMPLIEGCSLQELLAGYRPSPNEAGALFADVVAGVSCAHRARVVHRDLKPGNVLLELRAGRVRARVADFGVAKAIGLHEDGLGGFLGTPAYAAPEQISDAAAVDELADLWSLGVILSELLVGRLGPDGGPIPEPWDAVVRSLLQPDPTARIRSDALAEVVAALDLPADALDLASPVAEAVRLHLVAVEASAARIADLAPTRPTAARTTYTMGSTARHNLPRARDGFVGRERELAELGERLTSGAALVTLVGLGGAGKTRLVHRYAWEHFAEWPGGVWTCDVSDAHTEDGVALAVGRALDVPLGTQDPIGRLGHALAARGRCLVILDSFEVVAHLAAETVGRWIDLAPEGVFVVTSQETLGIPGEQVQWIDPLEPRDAAALFTQRARAAVPTFEAEEAQIEALVGLLDGLPLAIELAASRARVLGVAQLLEAMTDRFRLLTTPRSADRRGSLRATLDWSWNLLSPWEQAAMGQLSVFDGDFDLEAAEAVLELTDAPWTVDLLQSLADRSLIRAVGEGRLRPLHSVRDYARERLAEAGGTAAAERRHGVHYASFGVPRAIEALDRHGSIARRRALGRDLDNVVVACRRAVARGDTEVAVGTAAAAWQILLLTGPPAAAIALLEPVLNLPGSSSVAGRLLVPAGFARMLIGDFDRAQQWIEAAAADADPEVAASGLANLAVVAHRQGRLDEAEQRYLGALDVAGGRLRGMILRNLAIIDQNRGRMPEARARYEAALAIHREHGDRRAEGMTLANFGLMYLAIHALEPARSLIGSALAVFAEIGDRRGLGTSRGDLGLVHCLLADFDGALTHYQAALALHRETGDLRSEGAELGSIGMIHFFRGSYDLARAHLDRALELHRRLGNRASEARELNNLAGLAMEEGRHEEADALLAAARIRARECGSRRLEAEVEEAVGVLRLVEGSVDAAEAQLQVAIALARVASHRSLEAAIEGLLGEVARQRGRPEEARRRLDVAESSLRELHDPVELAKVLCSRMALEQDVGDVPAAERARAGVEEIIARIGAGPSSQVARRLARGGGLGPRLRE